MSTIIRDTFGLSYGDLSLLLNRPKSSLSQGRLGKHSSQQPKNTLLQQWLGLCSAIYADKIEPPAEPLDMERLRWLEQGLKLDIMNLEARLDKALAKHELWLECQANYAKAERLKPQFPGLNWQLFDALKLSWLGKMSGGLPSDLLVLRARLAGLKAERAALLEAMGEEANEIGEQP